MRKPRAPIYISDARAKAAKVLASLPVQQESQIRSVRQLVFKLFDEFKTMRAHGFSWERIAHYIKKAHELTTTANSVRKYFSDENVRRRKTQSRVALSPAVAAPSEISVSSPRETPIAGGTKPAPKLPQQERSEELQTAKSPGSTLPAGTLGAFNKL